MLARSPAGILNVRYARSTSNLFVDFAAPASPRYWKLAYNTPEKSTGTETAAGGGAGLVVSGAGCCASNATGRSIPMTTGKSFIENLRGGFRRRELISIYSAAAQPLPAEVEHSREMKPSSHRLCMPSAGNSRASLP